MLPEENLSDSKAYSGLKVALVVAGVSSGTPGGAERLYSGLYQGLSSLGLEAALVSVPADEPSFDAIMRNYQFCESLDLRSFDVVVSTKAPTYMVKHPCHVMYLVHTVRVFDDMFERNFPTAPHESINQRFTIHQKDVNAMTVLAARFAIGNEVAKRLYRSRGLDAEVLHPPLGVEGFSPGPQGDYFFLPGRLHPWKRVDLVIEAMKLSNLPMRLLITGTGEDEKRLRLLAGDDPRIEFTGKVSDEKLLELYSNCLAVPFVPLREDYGYITLEAFASHKPVITCADSGEPAHFVKNRQNGLICSPNPESLKQSLEWVFKNRQRALEMGQKAAAGIQRMSWRKAAFRLVDAALKGRKPHYVHRIATPPTVRVAVLDMQPIDPPLGGGRLRLLGLYHNLGQNFKTAYVGTYDWPGEQYRRHFLSETLEEIDIPLSQEHHDAARLLSEKTGGKSVIDIAFGKLGHLSPEYVAEAKRAVRESDIVIFSHPWAYSLVEEEISPTQYVVYDSHNVEGYLRAQLLDQGKTVEKELLRYVVEEEHSLGVRADLIFTCSHEDSQRFHRLYGFPFDKMRVVPNGVMAFSNSVMERADKQTARKTLGLDENAFIALFIGSAYAPNVEAAQFIVQQLAPVLPEITFVVAGGVGACVSSSADNVIITGLIDEGVKCEWLSSADIAVNPMFSGSGTNIKMFDFMAYSLPTVTTRIGSRGIETGNRVPFIEVEPEAKSFIRAINSLANKDLSEFMGEEARLCVEEAYAWEKISPHAGELVLARHRMSGQGIPFFSVIVTAFGRHEQLNDLLEHLSRQIERDFEVVIVDQNVEKWAYLEKHFGMPMRYIHTHAAGDARCRNTGASIAQGKIYCFLDAGFLPDDEWLLNMRELFRDESVCAAEARKENEATGRIDWAPLTEELVFDLEWLESNILLRSSFFHKTSGFNLLNEGADSSPTAAQRFFTLKGPSPRSSTTQKIGWISTWNTKCGIASYSRYLIDGICQDVTIFANYAEETVVSDEDFVKRCWRMDCEDFAELEIAVQGSECDVIVVQFHYGFFRFAQFAEFLDSQIDCGRKIVVMMHCTTDPVGVPSKQLKVLAETLKKCDTILVHSELDLERLNDYNIIKNVSIFPQGIFDYRPKKVFRSLKSSPLIASYGFFREHKGLVELVLAVNNLLQRGVSIKLLMVNSEYPAPDSKKTIEEALLVIKELGLDGEIKVVKDYLCDEDSIDMLSNADLVVFPYQNTTESSSAAVRHGIASGRPVAVTPLDIFEDLNPCVFKLPGITPEEIATGIEAILKKLKENDSDAIVTMQNAAEWSKKHRFSVLSKKLYQIIRGK